MKKNGKGAYTLIGTGTKIEGDVTIPHSVRVDGLVSGKMNIKGDVVVGGTGEIKADIQARNVTISGSVVGNLTVEGRIELEANASLKGDLQAKDLIIREGAFFHGNCAMCDTSANSSSENDGHKALSKKHVPKAELEL